MALHITVTAAGGHSWASQTFPSGDIQLYFALQAHYPERLSMLWMYEAPTIFWGLWQVSHAACRIRRTLVHATMCACVVPDSSSADKPLGADIEFPLDCRLCPLSLIRQACLCHCWMSACVPWMSIL